MIIIITFCEEGTIIIPILQTNKRKQRIKLGHRDDTVHTW